MLAPKPKIYVTTPKWTILHIDDTDRAQQQALCLNIMNARLSLVVVLRSVVAFYLARSPYPLPVPRMM